MDPQYVSQNWKHTNQIGSESSFGCGMFGRILYIRQAQELQTAEPAVERRRRATSIRGTITKRDAIVIGHIQRTKGVGRITI